MEFLEKDLELFLFSRINDLQNHEKDLLERGINILPLRYYRRVNLGSYGVADIIGIRIFRKKKNERKLEICIMELKKEEVNYSTLNQALNYAKGIQRIIELNNYNKYFTNISYTFYLIGKNVDRGSFIYLTDFTRNIHFYEYSITLDFGLLFNKINEFYLTNDFLPTSEKYLNELKKGLFHYSQGRF